MTSDRTKNQRTGLALSPIAREKLVNGSSFFTSAGNHLTGTRHGRIALYATTACIPS